MLREILTLESGTVMISGGGKRLARLYFQSWADRKGSALAEELPFPVEGEIYVGNPFRADFPVYLIVNPLTRKGTEREKLLRWLEMKREEGKLVLLYEERYVGDSIARYRIRNHLDYLIAYKRETMGAELLKVYKLENGRVVERKTYVRRPMTSGFGSEQ
ncbi:hypothetical protein [Thermococcus nautili]|uniref:Uncharacterized protein n=1 Tax=Thermococcus nautili TaxID=195522 RepID=W8NTE2_9EURY|nr:hypothetical protein [Thermococcus nautili]AHL22402.1 hypothetical protein BD01_0780 [Thermococcus nautili]